MGGKWECEKGRGGCDGTRRAVGDPQRLVHTRMSEILKIM